MCIAFIETPPSPRHLCRCLGNVTLPAKTVSCSHLLTSKLVILWVPTKVVSRVVTIRRSLLSSANLPPISKEATSMQPSWHYSEQRYRIHSLILEGEGKRCSEVHPGLNWENEYCNGERHVVGARKSLQGWFCDLLSVARPVFVLFVLFVCLVVRRAFELSRT